MPSRSQRVVSLRREIELESALEVCRRECVAITLFLGGGDDGIGRLDVTPTIVARGFHDGDSSLMSHFSVVLRPRNTRILSSYSALLRVTSPRLSEVFGPTTILRRLPCVLDASTCPLEEVYDGGSAVVTIFALVGRQFNAHGETSLSKASVLVRSMPDLEQFLGLFLEGTRSLLALGQAEQGVKPAGKVL